MAAPANTSRVNPSSSTVRWLPDGYQALIAFSKNPSIKFWEKGVKPPGMDGGEPIDQTTMHNTDWRTSRARQLKSMTPSTCRVAYDPAVYDQISTLINDDTGSVTWQFYDGSDLDVWAYLQKFEPDELVEGQQAEASITVVPTMFDVANAVEAGFTLTSVTGS